MKARLRVSGSLPAFAIAGGSFVPRLGSPEKFRSVTAISPVSGASSYRCALRCVRVTTVDGLRRCNALRHEVFVLEQGVDSRTEFDALDGEQNAILADDYLTLMDEALRDTSMGVPRVIHYLVTDDGGPSSGISAPHIAQATSPSSEDKNPSDGKPKPRDIATCRIRLVPSLSVEMPYNPHARAGESLVHGAKLERFCVAPSARQGGVGRQLLERIERDFSSASGALYCYAKAGTRSFYSRCGWESEGAEFLEAGVLHTVMLKRRSATPYQVRPNHPPRPAYRTLSHVCFRTHNIERTRAFYKLLGFEDETRFLVSGLRAAWVKVRTTSARPERVRTRRAPVYLRPTRNRVPQRPAADYARRALTCPVLTALQHRSPCGLSLCPSISLRPHTPRWNTVAVL